MAFICVSSISFFLLLQVLAQKPGQDLQVQFSVVKPFAFRELWTRHLTTAWSPAWTKNTNKREPLSAMSRVGYSKSTTSTLRIPKKKQKDIQHGRVWPGIEPGTG